MFKSGLISNQPRSGDAALLTLLGLSGIVRYRSTPNCTFSAAAYQPGFKLGCHSATGC